ncbi:DUF6931 family protein [Actibacterium ureilyticum]|uniref:DUF6931 family protein n=1 Tax=Actibacterium ureilyticum TaxID=1590614 RepID=UPI000BAAE501|nr:hypothetical protein [Actibacterium ureilyticum]
MTERFADLKKIPPEPAARVMSGVNYKLKTRLDLPASATVPEVLTALAEKEAWIDVLKLLSAALPPRECVWWACLAARDIVGEGPENATPCLKAAEAWVFKPDDKNRQAVRASLDNVYVDDDTSLCATAAMYAPGDMGPGDLADFPAPQGAVEACVFGMVIEAVGAADDFDGHMQVVIDRALDIARGGNGQVEALASSPTDKQEEGV